MVSKMKYIVGLLLVAFLMTGCTGLTKKDKFIVITKAPQVVGGPEAIYQYIDEHNLYPEKAKVEGVDGIVILTFKVDVDGKVSNIRVKVESPKYMGFGKAAKSVLKAMTFTPAYQLDTPVEVYSRQKITFAPPKDKKED
ncbi:energy transducer TonB [bacterium]|nr:energy transducer TonB [bacterium]